MLQKTLQITAAAALMLGASTASYAAGPTDPQIAHIAYTAGNIDIAAGKQALVRSRSKAVRAFASEMIRDHTAVNSQALSLLKKLHVTPEDNPTSASLSKDAAATLRRLSTLKGRSFDRAYVTNEVAYHKTVNGALADTLIPSANNGALKSLLQTGLTLFREHQHHAEHLSASLK